ARPSAAFDDAEIYTCQYGSHAGSLRQGASTCATSRRNSMIRSQTILCFRQDGHVAMAGDGQVSMNNTVVKHHARKVRKVYHDRTLTGFGGAAGDAFTVFGRLGGG